MVLLSSLAALLWGSGNFSMGIGVRRSTARATVIVGFAVGLLGALVFLTIQRPTFTISSLLWGGAAGVAQGSGWIAFARSISKTSLGIAAPVTAAVTTVTLLVYSLGQGSPLSALSLIGIGVSLSSIAVFGRGSSKSNVLACRSDSQGLAYAATAGVLFAGQALALVNAGTTSSSLVLVGTGLGVVTLLGITAIIRPIARRSYRLALGPAAGGGMIIFFGDLSYLYALHRGAPATSSVIAQLHPLLTAILAAVVLRERLRNPQIVGLFLSVGGVALIGAGRA